MKVPLAASVILILLAPAHATSAPYAAPDGLADALDLATGVRAPAPPAADAPLAELVLRADARFGILREPAAYGALAALDPALASVTADLLAALLFAAAERDAAFGGVSGAELAALADDEGSPEALALLARIDGERVRLAAASLAAAVDAARPALLALAKTPAPGGALAAAPLVDLFPVIGIDPLGVDNVFPHDYFLSIDLGGNDVYDNNAGGSIITRGFKIGDPSTFGPTVAGLTIGGEFEDAEESYTATLAIDVAGDDTYGVYKTPSLVGGSKDKLCTQGPLVRRIVVQGAGSGGIGMLVDLGGQDAYRAKTLAQGLGHVTGVGILFDAGGSDSYTAIRSAQGAAVLQGVGILVDRTGDDRYEMKAPPGGIFNVDSGRCDATQRLARGVSVIQAAGLFFDGDGDDWYKADAQAFGHVEAMGVGSFFDLRGTDDYNGYVARADGVQRAAPASGGGAAVFADLD